MTPPGRDPSIADLQAALDAGRYADVADAAGEMLERSPGNDAAHELRARAFLALGRPVEAEQHAADAVRLDPEEIRYRELMAQILSAEGAHRDAAAEYGRLARNDPRETAWTVAEAEERLGAAQPGMGVEAARRAVRVAPRNGRAQLALSQALARTGDARGAFQAATLATELLPGEPAAREALADAHWLVDEAGAALREYRSLVLELEGAERRRVVRKARTLVRQRGGRLARMLARLGPVFRIALTRGWIRIGR